jgi:hypothetical protein
MSSILGFLLELIIKIWRFGKKIFKIWRFWTIFLMKKPLNSLKTYSSGRNLAKFRPKRKSTNCIMFRNVEKTSNFFL